MKTFKNAFPGSIEGCLNQKGHINLQEYWLLYVMLIEYGKKYQSLYMGGIFTKQQEKSRFWADAFQWEDSYH